MLSCTGLKLSPKHQGASKQYSFPDYHRLRRREWRHCRGCFSCFNPIDPRRFVKDFLAKIVNLQSFPLRKRKLTIVAQTFISINPKRYFMTITSQTQKSVRVSTRRQNAHLSIWINAFIVVAIVIFVWVIHILFCSTHKS